ncbi:MAG: helix-turn-helix domain-containing protein [Planctomycetia bacterium]|nr:helix-turn-helix domain-containing protein [Planctomycetia bacterium]
MKNPTGRKPFFERLKTGLEQGIRHARGELALRTTTVPSPPPVMPAREIVGLRKRLELSTDQLARILNVSTKTVLSWEQGRRRPSQAALRLLQILAAKPRMVGEILGWTVPVGG